ncbi:MAG: undecaprenyl-phosphate alpha-N-acetylglucosaminyl 1-phosphate transferase [Alphaproteobacteria bacterium]|nr:undecaprenyl-phosphate alpha-N-acetylglucosaminyl 1-phosphate transferase [Alphaproteobacteria bacterium]
MQAILYSFLFTLVSISFLVPIANKIGLVDVPNGRKLHIGSIPLVGGISIYLGVIIYFILFMPFSSDSLLYLIGASLLVTVGVLDDLKDLKVVYRLFIQTLCAVILVGFSGNYFDNLGFVENLGFIELGYVGIVVTVLFIVANINSYNMIDGIDGLLGMVSLTSFVSFALLFSLNSSSLTLVPVVISISIVVYLAFNLKIANFMPKVFIGDAGAMFLGYTISWLAIMGSVVEHAFRPVTVMFIIAVPFIDLVFNIFNRLRKGQSPIRPGRDHVHHRLMDRGYSSRRTVGIVSLLSIGIALIGILGEYFKISELTMLSVYLLIMIAYTLYFICTSKWVPNK